MTKKKIANNYKKTLYITLLKVQLVKNIISLTDRQIENNWVVKL